MGGRPQQGFFLQFSIPCSHGDCRSVGGLLQLLVATCSQAGGNGVPGRNGPSFSLLSHSCGCPAASGARRCVVWQLQPSLTDPKTLTCLGGQRDARSLSRQGPTPAHMYMRVLEDARSRKVGRGNFLSNSPSLVSIATVGDQGCTCGGWAPQCVDVDWSDEGSTQRSVVSPSQCLRAGAPGCSSRNPCMCLYAPAGAGGPASISETTCGADAPRTQQGGPSSPHLPRLWPLAGHMCGDTDG